MRPLLNALPVDWHGTSADNRTKGEVHDLSEQYDLPYRIVVLQNGYFYSDEESPLYIIDERNRVLKEGIDYQTLSLNQSIVAITGKPAFALMVITNPDVGNRLLIDAQMVGGIYCRLDQAILAQSVNTIVSTNKKVQWKKIKDKPSNFRPSGHLHALWELYGFTYQTSIIARMTTAKHRHFDILFQALYDQFNTAFDRANYILDTAKALLKNHMADLNNPHELTKAQLGLSILTDGPIATEAQARATSGNIMYAYATPLRAAQSIETNFTSLFNPHVSNYSNPHRVTAAQLGAVTVAEVNGIAAPYYDRGSTVKYAAGIYVQPLNRTMTYDQYFSYARTNIPLSSLISGVFPQNMIGTQAAGAGGILVPGFGGYMQWLDLGLIFGVWSSFAEAD